LEDAVDWYNQQEQGLGARFRAEVAQAVERILIFPEGWTKISRRSRRCLTRKFPYGVIYQVREDSILIVAIAELHRRPGYWKDRPGGG
jgi:hypothetical protein